jgi:hypothetical protein
MGKARAERFKIERSRCQFAGAPIRHQYVCRGQERSEFDPIAFKIEIQRADGFAAAPHRRGGMLIQKPRSGRLNGQDFGPEVSKNHGGDGNGGPSAQFDDAQIAQGIHGVKRPSLMKLECAEIESLEQI